MSGWENGRFNLFLQGVINTMHKCLGLHSAVCLHITRCASYTTEYLDIKINLALIILQSTQKFKNFQLLVCFGKLSCLLIKIKIWWSTWNIPWKFCVWWTMHTRHKNQLNFGFNSGQKLLLPVQEPSIMRNRARKW